MGVPIGGGRMFWSAQAGAVGNVAVIPGLHHLSLDVLAAGMTSLIVCAVGLAHLVHQRTHPHATLHSHLRIHEDHLYWGVAACSWAILAAMSHAPGPHGVGAYALTAVTVATMVGASLNGSAEEAE